MNKADKAHFYRMIEHWFIFSLVWSIGATVVGSDRPKIDSFIRKSEVQLPPLNTVYDYWVNPSKKEWSFWKQKLSDEWRPLANAQFHNILVPTIDTVRNTHIINYLQNNKYPILCTGNTGTGKTVVIQNVMKQMDDSRVLKVTINFSSATSAQMVQSQLDDRLVKHHGDIFIPSVYDVPL